MSFGSGKVQYTISVEDAQASSKIQGVSQQFAALGKSTQSASQQMQQVPQTFQTIVQEGNKVTTTTKQIQQTMQGTVTTVTTATKANQSFGDVLKNNVLSISIAASSIIGLISQYTSLRKAQIVADKAAVAEITTRNKVIDLTNKLAATIQKYGAGSTQAAKGARDLAAAQEKAAIAADRNEVIQSQLNERIAEFAVNILPNVIGAVGSVIQVVQGFSKAETVSTVTTIENTGAQVANATATKLSGVAVKGLVPPLKAMATAEIAAGTAATVAGGAMRKALIRTGIGALLVAAGTALVAFAENWYGFRDAVNAAGVALGNFMPQLKPVLDFLGGTVGGAILSLFGVEIPKAAAKTDDALGEVGDAADQSAQEATKAAEEIASAWKKTVDDLIVMPGSVHKEWKEQFQKLRKLGFTKGGIHELKDQFFRPAGIAKSITDSISEALQIVGKTKISGKSMKGLANNMIDSINEGIKAAKGQLDFMGPLVEIIKANKKNVNLPKLVADWFSGLPAELKAKLTSFGIDADTIVKNLGFDPAKLKPAIQSAFSQMGLDAGSVGILDKGMKAWMGGGTTGGKSGWLADIIESIKTAFSPANLESVRQQLVAGLFAAPGNVASLIRNFIDPVLAQVIDAMVLFGTKMVPQWISSTFTFANVSAAISTIAKFGAGIAAGIWAAITDPAGSAKAILKWATDSIAAIGAGLQFALPGTIETLKKIGANIITAIGDPATIAPAIFSFVTDAVNGIGIAFTGLISSITPTLSAAFSGLFSNAATWFKGLIDAAVEVAKTIPSTIAAWIGQIPSVISGVFSNAVSWFKGLLDAVITIAKLIAPTIAAWIKQKTSEVITAALNVGNQIGAKIREGILATLNAEGNWLASWFKLPEAEGAGGGGHRILTDQDKAGLIPKPGSNTPPIKPPITAQTPTQINLQNTQAMAVIKATANAITDLTGILPQINLQNKQAMAIITKTANAVTDLTAIESQINLQNKQAMKIITNTANAITDLTGIQPQINLQNKNAMKIITKTANAITDLTGVKPQINLQNKNAMKVITKTANAITDLTGIKPQINLQNKDALKTISATDKKIKALSQTVTITTNHINKVKTVMVAKGFHGVVNSPMNFTAGEAGPELVNVTPLSDSGGGTSTSIVRRGRGGGGDTGAVAGDLVVNNMIDLGDSRIIRSFKRKLGSDRYTFGG